MDEAPPTTEPSFDQIYLADTIEGVGMYCDTCGQEILTTSSISVIDIIEAACRHKIEDHQGDRKDRRRD